MLPCNSKKSLYTYIGNWDALAFQKLITFCNPFKADRFYRWMKVWLCFSDVILVNEVFSMQTVLSHVQKLCLFITVHTV